MNEARKLTISFILSSLWLSGGVRDIVEYTNGLTARGHRINLVFPGGTYDTDMAAEIDPRVQLIETVETGDPSASLAAKARLTWSLARAVPPSQIVVSTHTPSTAAGSCSPTCCVGDCHCGSTRTTPKCSQVGA